VIRASITGGSTLTISGLNPEIARREVQDWLGDVAEQIDERIAKDWSNERAAGRKMPANTEATDQRKAAEGLSLKVGTATGNLQDHLDSGGYWTIGAVSRGRATIRWEESKLQGDVGYAEYVAERKVRGGQILVLLAKDARMAERYMADRQNDWEAARRRTEGRRDTKPATTSASRTRAKLGSRVRVF
jgi:hypothetical protein